MDDRPLTFRRAAFAEIHPLRRAVLRPADHTLHFDGDDAPLPHTWHFGAFTPTGENIACLTLLTSSWENQPALQLRGMAVAATSRGKGVGAQLLRHAEQTIAANPATCALAWWCNARVEAIGFYERLGWQVASKEFMIESVGPHRKMTRSPAGTR